MTKLQVMDNWNRPFGFNPTVFLHCYIHFLAFGVLILFPKSFCQVNNFAGGQMVVMADIIISVLHAYQGGKMKLSLSPFLLHQLGRKQNLY